MNESNKILIKEEEKEPIDLRLTIKPDDPIYNIFLKIKKASGIKNNSEVLRFTLKQMSLIPFSELFFKMGKEINIKT